MILPAIQPKQSPKDVDPTSLVKPHFGHSKQVVRDDTSEYVCKGHELQVLF